MRKLISFIVPRDHAGRGAYDNNDRIPPIAWVGAALFILGWIGFQSLAHGAGFY